MMTENYLDMSLDEFAARFAPAVTPDETPVNYFVHNRETGKLELHFDKADYDALTAAQKQSIKGAFVWGRKSGCWISRCKEPNLYSAKRVAESLGLADGGRTGERLPFAEQQQRKVERAERRAERFSHAADTAERRADVLQKPINDMRGDIAFFTQPNINTSAGRAFTRRRDKLFAAFEKGFDEYRKSEYFRDRAETARRTADQAELKDSAFIVRRIRECESTIRKLRKSIEKWETSALPKAKAGTIKRYNGEPMTVEAVEEQLEIWLDRLEAQLDKLGYYQDALDALGGVQFSQENIKPGYTVKIKSFGACKVMSTGPKNFTAATQHGMGITYSYAEITEIVSDQPDAPKRHPFKVGEAFTLRNGSTHTITRITAKAVTLSDGEKTYRVMPKYRPIPAQSKWMWTLMVGSGCWASDIIYRD